MEVISFTGGLGAQILSAGAYFYLQHLGAQVAADLAYLITSLFWLRRATKA
jgi:hypothetical protein